MASLALPGLAHGLERIASITTRLVNGSDVRIEVWEVAPSVFRTRSTSSIRRGKVRVNGIERHHEDPDFLTGTTRLDLSLQVTR